MASAFTTHLTKNRFKGCSPGQLLFVRNMILPIKCKVDWELILHKNQTQIIKENIRKNIKQVEQDYKVRYKVILNNHSACKYETPYKGPFVITKCCMNGTFTIKYCAKQIRK